MLITIIAATASLVSPTERSIIVDAVKAEVSGGSPTFGPIPAGAEFVCGRVNGDIFQVSITRNSHGRISTASRVSVLDAGSDALGRMMVTRSCLDAGYHVLW